MPRASAFPLAVQNREQFCILWRIPASEANWDKYLGDLHVPRLADAVAFFSSYKIIAVGTTGYASSPSSLSLIDLTGGLAFSTARAGQSSASFFVLLLAVTRGPSARRVVTCRWRVPRREIVV